MPEKNEVRYDEVTGRRYVWSGNRWRRITLHVCPVCSGPYWTETSSKNERKTCGKGRCQTLLAVKTRYHDKKRKR